MLLIHDICDKKHYSISRHMIIDIHDIIYKISDK